jgi:hypothetical protein
LLVPEDRKEQGLVLDRDAASVVATMELATS